MAKRVEATWDSLLLEHISLGGLVAVGITVILVTCCFFCRRSISIDGRVQRVELNQQRSGSQFRAGKTAVVKDDKFFQ